MQDENLKLLPVLLTYPRTYTAVSQITSSTQILQPQNCTHFSLPCVCFRSRPRFLLDQH